MLLCCTSSLSYSEEPKTTEIYNSGTNYSDDFSVSIGVQQALSQQGIILNGIDYGFNYRIGSNPTEGRCFNWFLGFCTDWRQVVTQDTHISGGTKITDADGNVVVNQNQYWSATTGWTSYSNTLTIPDDGLLYKDIGTLSFDYVLHDDVNLSNIWADAVWIYDPCYLDPLTSVTCPGYAAAYAAQQLEEMSAQQTEEPIVETIIEETTAAEPSSQPDSVTSGNSESSQEMASEETNNTETNERSSRDAANLARSLDGANNFDLSSVTGGATNPDEELANDIIGAAEAAAADAVANLTQSSIESSRQEEQQVSQQETVVTQNSFEQMGGTSNEMDMGSTQAQDTMGLDTIQTEVQSSLATTQVTRPVETRQERRERLKEITEKRANEISEENADADSMDEQTQQQTEQLALMNYVPGFDAYQTFLPGGVYPDVPFYKPTTVPESKRGLRNGLAQQLLHEQMIEMQYRREQ